MGQRVRVMVDQAQGPGSYKVEWDARDASGQDVAPGMYLYRLEVGNQVAVGKMLLAK
jgi:flagellar hook assembly protein FlgD